MLAAQWRRQWQAALLTFAIAAVFDLLFLVISELPATVPVALALIVTEGYARLSVLRHRRRPSMRADAIPRQAR